MPYTPKNLERFQIAVQRLVLIHPRELEIPKVKDIDPVTSMKALPEDAKKAVQDTERKKDIKEDALPDAPEAFAFDGQYTDKALKREEPKNI